MHPVTRGAFVSIRGLLVLLLGLCLAVWSYPTVAAAPAQQTTIEGPVEDIAFSAIAGDPQFIAVNGTVIQLPPGYDTTRLAIGTGVRVTGQKEGDVFVAREVTVTSAPRPEPSIADHDDGDDNDNDDNDENDNGDGDDNDNDDNGDDNDNGGGDDDDDDNANDNG